MRLLGNGVGPPVRIWTTFFSVRTKENSGGLFAPEELLPRPEEVCHRHARGIGVFFFILGALVRASPPRARVLSVSGPSRAHRVPQT